MLKILWKRGKIAPEEQFLPLSTIFYYLMLDFYVKTGIRFSVRDKRLFEITEVEIMRVDCIMMSKGRYLMYAVDMLVHILVVIISSYRRLSLSRLRLSRITAYLEQKI